MKTLLCNFASGVCRPSYRLMALAATLFVILGIGHTTQAALLAPVLGNACSPLGTTAMTSAGTDILYCLVNPAGGAPAYIWQRGGSSTVNLNVIPTCAAGQALNFSGKSFTCVSIAAAYPVCGANQALTNNGTTFICTDLSGGGIPPSGGSTPPSGGDSSTCTPGSSTIYQVSSTQTGNTCSFNPGVYQNRGGTCYQFQSGSITYSNQCQGQTTTTNADCSTSTWAWTNVDSSNCPGMSSTTTADCGSSPSNVVAMSNCN